MLEWSLTAYDEVWGKLIAVPCCCNLMNSALFHANKGMEVKALCCSKK